MKEYVISLVLSIVSITIIEMILPSNKTKKYAMFVSTIILVIAIINPIIVLFDKNINLEDIFNDSETFLASSEYTAKLQYAKEKEIGETYNMLLEEDIVNRLKERGYIVKDIFVEIDKESYEPVKINLEIEHDDGTIQDVVIDVSSNNTNKISNIEISKVKDILYETYEIEKNKIIVNGIS